MKKGIINMNEVHDEAARIAGKDEKMKVNWGKLTEKTSLKIAAPWRLNGGLPWYTIGTHVNLPVDPKIIMCPESVPKNYKPLLWSDNKECPICALKRKYKSNLDRNIAKLWMRHYVNAFVDEKKELSVIGLPTLVKDSLVVQLEEGLDFTDSEKITVIKIVKKGIGESTKYHILYTTWSNWQEPEVIPYNLDKVFEYYFSQEFIGKLKLVAEVLTDKLNFSMKKYITDIDLPNDFDNNEIFKEEQKQKQKNPTILPAESNIAESNIAESEFGIPLRKSEVEKSKLPSPKSEPPF